MYRWLDSAHFRMKNIYMNLDDGTNVVGNQKSRKRAEHEIQTKTPTTTDNDMYQATEENRLIASLQSDSSRSQHHSSHIYIHVKRY